MTTKSIDQDSTTTGVTSGVMPGRKIEVTFFDGEKIVGTTQAYNPSHKGFFVFPADGKGNSLRVFVVNWNVRDVKFL